MVLTVWLPAAELDRIKNRLAALDAKQQVFRVEDVASAGVVISDGLDQVRG